MDLEKIKKREIKLSFEEALLFGVIFAFIDAELALGFDSASFASIFASEKRRKLEKGAFAAERAHCGSPSVSSFSGIRAMLWLS